MKKHLRYRLMAMMLLLVVVVVLFVGGTLLFNIMADYNRTFYEDMEELTAVVEFFDTKEEELAYLPEVLGDDDLLDPIRTDRYYYVLKDELVLYTSDPDWTVTMTPNLEGALAGEENQKAGILAETLDYAYAMKVEGHVFYVLDLRTGLMETIETYMGFFIQTLVVGMLLTVVLAFVFARRFLIPIHKLTEEARSMEKNGTFTGIEVTTKDEVGQLTQVFNEMGVRITENIKMLKALLQNIPKPLFAVNERGETVHANEAYRLLFEQEPPLSLFIEGHEQENRFLLSLEGRYFLVYRTPLRLNDAAATLFLLDDITEAELLDQERKQFVADVSHELKTPLTVIKSYSETLLDEAVEGEMAKRFLGVIEKSADQMNGMVNQLLELIKTETTPQNAKEPLDLVAAAKEVVDAMALELKKKELTCLVELPLERVLLCDPDQVRRVMINLLSNSVKYSNQGGTITLSLKETEGGVLLAVKDEGIGIEKKHLPHLFEKFYRVDKARSRETGGTGLGLSIVKSIMDSMGGWVQVESTLGEGSTFTCYFPD